MSTTLDLKVAVAYGTSERSLLLKFKVGNFMQLGADMQWLSAFPSEAEICYPPLTYLKPTGRVQTVRVEDRQFDVIEVEPFMP